MTQVQRLIIIALASIAACGAVGGCGRGGAGAGLEGDNTAGQHPSVAAALATVERVLGESLPEGSVARRWALLAGKDPTFIAIVDVPAGSWDAPQFESAGLLVTRASRSLGEPDGKPAWARQSAEHLSIDSTIWSDSTGGTTLAWVVSDTSSTRTLAVMRTSIVEKLPPSVHSLFRN